MVAPPAEYRLPSELNGLASIIKRYDAAARNRDNCANLYRDCYRYAIPSRQLFIEYAPGQEKENELFDSTAVDAVAEFANAIQALTCPAWRRWSVLTPGPLLPKDDQKSQRIRDALDEQTNILFAHLNFSNFTLKSHEAFIDLAVGTGALVCDLNDTMNGLVFDCVPSARLAIEAGPMGSIETVFEDKKPPIRDIKRMYQGRLRLPEPWQKEKEEVEKAIVQGVVYEPKTKHFFLVVFTKDPKALMYVRDMGTSSSYIVFRWNVVPGEVFGRGPVVNALADIRTLNIVVEFMLRGAALTLCPPLTGITDGILNPYTVQIVPDTVIPVKSNDRGNPSLAPLLASIKPELAQFILADMRQAVRHKLLADPRRRDGPIQSATEVLIEDREFVQSRGGSFGRLQAEFSQRVVARAVYLLQSVGLMAKISVDGKEVTLQHTSPLARAQDTDDLQAIAQAAALAAQVAGPEMYQLAIKTEELPGIIFRKSGVDANVVRDEAERTQKATELRDQALALAQAESGAEQEPPAPTNGAGGELPLAA